MQKKPYLTHTLKQSITILKEKLSSEQIKKSATFLFKEKRIMGIFGYIIYFIFSFIVKFEVTIDSITFILKKLKIPVTIFLIGTYLTLLPQHIVLILCLISLFFLESKVMLAFFGIISFISLLVVLAI